MHAVKPRARPSQAYGGQALLATQISFCNLTCSVLLIKAAPQIFTRAHRGISNAGAKETEVTSKETKKKKQERINIISRKSQRRES